MDGEWILHDGGKCPCVGAWVEAHLPTGELQIGVALDHVEWRYVTHYRLIPPPQSHVEREREVV